MPVTVARFEQLRGLYDDADKVTRLFFPEFEGGWYTINMQRFRTNHTIDRLLTIQGTLRIKSNILASEMKALREANPGRKTRDNKRTSLAARRAGVMIAIPSNALPRMRQSMTQLTNGDVDEDEKDRMHAAKVKFEKEDYALRHKLEGLKLLQDLVNDSLQKLESRRHRYDRLHTISNKWMRQVYEERDFHYVESAQEYVVEGSREVKEICAMLDVLEETFIDGDGLRLKNPEPSLEEMNEDMDTEMYMGWDIEMEMETGQNEENEWSMFHA